MNWRQTDRGGNVIEGQWNWSNQHWGNIETTIIATLSTTLSLDGTFNKLKMNITFSCFSIFEAECIIVH